MKFRFEKYQGAGNDFIISDQLFLLDENQINLTEFIQTLCNRRLGVGADGLIFLEKKNNDKLKIYFFNSDGKKGSLCGNGARCALNFALKKGLISKGLISFLFWENKYFANCFEEGIEMKMNDIDNKIIFQQGFFIDTGSPHLVIEFDYDQSEGAQLLKKALSSRHHSNFQPGGTNVNFLHPKKTKEGNYRIITFERGVEDFTYACGTGAVAVAAYLAWKNKTAGTFNLISQGGLLKVKIGDYSENSLSNVWLTGPVTEVFKGVIYYNQLLKMRDNFNRVK